MSKGGVIWIAVAAFAAFALVGSLRATPPDEAQATLSDQALSRKIIGAWDQRKHVTYFPDGTWMLQRYAGDAAEAGTFRWSIHDGTLILIRDGHRFIRTIKSLSATELVLQADEGQEVDVRGVEDPLPFPQVIRNGQIFPPDGQIVERALETIYNTLRSRLGPAAREKLERDQRGWLTKRDTLRANTDPLMIKGTVENLTYFTVERVLELRRQLEVLSTKPLSGLGK